MLASQKNLTPMEQAADRLVAFHLNIASCMDCAAFIRATEAVANDQLQSLLLEASWVSFQEQTADVWN